MPFMVNDALLVIVPIVAVNELPVYILVVGKGDTVMFSATFARNNQCVTARVFLLFL